jgi:hypothetical protein
MSVSDFARLEQYRASLIGRCARMLGSVDDMRRLGQILSRACANQTLVNLTTDTGYLDWQDRRPL